MIMIEEVSRSWRRDCEWRIAPAGLSWVAEGAHLIVRKGSSIGDDSSIGNYSSIGDGSHIGNGSRIGDSSRIGKGSSIGNYSSIGDGSHIGNGSRIGDYSRIGKCSRIGDRSHIGDYSHIDNESSLGNESSIGDYSHIGDRSHIGNRSSIGDYSHIGDDSRIGDRSRNAIDLGWADGYRKCLAQVNGVAYIGAGCRWFTLDDAIAHWSAMGESRALTMCLMQSAVAIAGYRGWATSAALAKGEK